MKRKATLTLISLACAVSCAFSFVACGKGGGKPHTSHNWSASYTEDGDRHYQTCDGCNERKYSDGHSYDLNGFCVCGKQKPEAEPTLLSIGDSFTKTLAVYSTDNILNENNTETTFNQLLDRQFDVLAEDILYRLYVTYGENTYGTDSDFGDLELNGGNYIVGGNKAKVVKNNLLTNDTEHTSNHEVNIDCPYCYQNVILTSTNNHDQKLHSYTNIIISSAISGEYMYYDAYHGNLCKHNDELGYDSDGDGIFDAYHEAYDPTPYKWQFNDYSKWNTEYREQFKLSLAKIVYGDEQTSLTYSELLSKIDRLGFTNDDKAKIIEYINNSVIGTNLIAENLRIYNLFSESDKSKVINWTAQEEIDKHYYKGYNIIVPAIVEQALNNTFDGALGLYPIVTKQVTSAFELNGLRTERDYKKIVLMPKTSSVLVTKISAKFYSENSQNKTVTVKATVKNAAGALVSEKTVGTVNLTNAGSEVELDISCASTIGIYTGDLTGNDNISLFGTKNAVNYGDNYVELSFEYDDGVTFGVEFLG